MFQRCQESACVTPTERRLARYQGRCSAGFGGKYKVGSLGTGYCKVLG